MLRLLTQREAALNLRLSERTLERLRVTGTGPRFVRAGRSIRYREIDIESWIASRVVGSTSEEISNDRLETH
jgi:predicted DNA-binding transcriptional regulator AlpA